ncbi:phosphonate ABC transporter, permease protein PhnE [Furfurilactobacillus milii]|uniref:phosphonate ABC transporter, permease protein PhnE n=1 Tax=Furfurilactobacillus milii TaxID=2888272 RepID=UPI003D64BC82
MMGSIQHRSAGVWHRTRSWFWGLLIVIVYVWGIFGINFSKIQSSAGAVTKAVLMGIIHPDWHYVYQGNGEDLVSVMLQTLAIAFVGTIISARISIPFAFWAAKRRRHHFSVLSTSGRIVLAVVRTFPEIVLAIMFIKAVGPGAFAGVLALGVHSVGMLGKLFAESIEAIDAGPGESILSVGGNAVNGLVFATLPQVLPAFASYSLYRFEISVRSATILGMVGAGGVGTPLLFAIQTRSWNRVGIILIGIIITVTIIDYLSGWLRKQLG